MKIVLSDNDMRKEIIVLYQCVMQYWIFSLCFTVASSKLAEMKSLKNQLMNFTFPFFTQVYSQQGLSTLILRRTWKKININLFIYFSFFFLTAL